MQVKSKEAALFIVACAALVSGGCARKLAAPLSANMKNALAIRSEFQANAGSGGAVASANPLDAVDRSNPTWATLTGTFRVEGEVPPNDPLKIDKDQSVCAPGGTTVYKQTVVTGPNNELQYVLLFLDTKLPAEADEDNPVWVHPEYSYKLHPEKAEGEFDQQNCLFKSHVFAMRSDQTLKIMNSDPILHNTKLSTQNAKPLNESIPAHSFTTYAPEREEKAPISVACSVHPWMEAWLISRDSPYFAVTDTSGNFKIENIPAGVELEFRVWQEKAKFLKSVKVDGTEVPLSKGRYKVKLDPDEERHLEFVVDAGAFR